MELSSIIIDIVSRIIIPILSILGTLLLSYSAFKKQLAESNKVKKESESVNADTADQLTDTALKIVKKLEQEVAELRDTLKQQKDEYEQKFFCQTQQTKELTADIINLKSEKAEQDLKLQNLTALTAYLLKGVRVLIHQLEESGKVPEWTPDQDLINKLSE